MYILQGNYGIFQCSNFQTFSVNDRLEFFKKQRSYFNCFSTHSVRYYVLKLYFAKCGKKRNSLIHFEKIRNTSTFSVPQQTYYPLNTVREITPSTYLNPNAASF